MRRAFQLLTGSAVAFLVVALYVTVLTRGALLR